MVANAFDSEVDYVNKLRIEEYKAQSKDDDANNKGQVDNVDKILESITLTRPNG